MTHIKQPDFVTFARGARCVLGPKAPEVARGQSVLVVEDDVDTTGIEGCPPGTILSLISYDGEPKALDLVPADWLMPLESRLCISLDPTCTPLEPCDGCLDITRGHLRTALARANVSIESAGKFVQAWNEARADARQGVRDTVKQARDWAALDAEKKMAAVVAESQAAAKEPKRKKTKAATAAEAPGAGTVAEPRGENDEEKSATGQPNT